MEKIEINNETKIVFDSLEGAGYECFMVGGCVRDYLRGVPPHDIDFATSATPEQIKECFAGYHIIETGIKHGTVTVIIRHIPFEISTYKTDTFRLGEPAARATIHDDLAHRDLTINAIAYHPERGFIDSFEGRRDLERGIIRSVNDPVDRFTEDPLRILRVLRFAAMLGFKIEAQTLSVCVAMAPALKNISPERIRDELCKTIVAPHGHEIMLRFVDIWGAVIPEILKMKGFEQKNPHHIYDVLEHTCVALANTKPELPLRLAVLFHDIGKPECFTIDERGVGHFYGHAKFSADIARAIINRLKFDNDTKANVLTLIKYHDLDIQPNFRYLKKLSLQTRRARYGQKPRLCAAGGH